MPRYWFTTHWPRLIGGPEMMDVYLKDREAAPGLAKADKIFIYEYQSGPGLVLESGKIQKRERGQGGVTCEATIVTDLKARPPEESFETYSNGKQANWQWIAETGHYQPGFVKRETVNELLGYNPGYMFYGFNAGRGIRPLDPDQYAKLKAAFDASRK